MENYKICFFQSLVDFMYKAELSLDQTNVQELLIAADMIQLKEASWQILNMLGFIGVSSSAANLQYPDSTWIRP
jgi:hypothetical protein